MKAPLHLSLVVPAYNEEARLPTSLPQIMAFANSQPFRVEVIIVNNNSGDRTRQIADEFARHSDCLRVIDQPIQGKGAAVRAGMLAANGDYCMIADADLSMPIAEVTKFLPPNVPTYDIAIGSRELPGSQRINEPRYRHLMGRAFSAYVKAIAVSGIEDTQCGFKCFRQSIAREIFSLQVIDGFVFNVKIHIDIFDFRKIGKQVTGKAYRLERLGSRRNDHIDRLNAANDRIRILRCSNNAQNGQEGHSNYDMFHGYD